MPKKPAEKKTTKKPTPRTRKVAASPEAPAAPKQAGAGKMFLITEQELNNLTHYVVEASTHDLKGRDFMVVLGSVQRPRQRPAPEK